MDRRATAGAVKRIDLEDTLEELGPGSSPRHGSLRCRTSARVGAIHEELLSKFIARPPGGGSVSRWPLDLLDGR